MTEMENLSQSNDSSSNVNIAHENVPSQVTESQEKLFKQSEVNDIVKRVKHEAVESTKRMAQEQPDYFRQKYSSSEFSQNTVPDNSKYSSNDMKQIAAEEVQRLLDERFRAVQRNADEEASKKIATEFFNKINTGKEKYQDFDQAMGTINLPQYSNAVQLANNFPNTADMWYHLVNDPVKLEAIETMAIRSPQAAHLQMQKLSKSLQDNEASANVKVPNSPLSQLRPSNTGTDSGIMSVSDLRKKYKG